MHFCLLRTTLTATAATQKTRCHFKIIGLRIPVEFAFRSLQKQQKMPLTSYYAYIIYQNSLIVKHFFMTFLCVHGFFKDLFGKKRYYGRFLEKFDFFTHLERCAAH